MKKKLFEAKNINISKIIDNQNERHKEEAEQRLKEKEKEKEQKQREEKQKEREERQNLKREERQIFCTFYNLYHRSSAHYCHLLKRWIRVDHVNLVMLKGDTQEQVEAVATEGKTKGTATVESFPTKTKMFEELARMKRFKMLEKETEKEEKRKVEEPI